MNHPKIGPVLMRFTAEVAAIRDFPVKPAYTERPVPRLQMVFPDGQAAYVHTMPRYGASRRYLEPVDVRYINSFRGKGFPVAVCWTIEEARRFARILMAWHLHSRDWSLYDAFRRYYPEYLQKQFDIGWPNYSAFGQKKSQMGL